MSQNLLSVTLTPYGNTNNPATLVDTTLYPEEIFLNTKHSIAHYVLNMLCERFQKISTEGSLIHLSTLSATTVAGCRCTQRT